MITPATLLRETALGGLVLAGFAVAIDEGAAVGVCVGAVLSVASVLGLIWATRALGTPAFAGRLLLQQGVLFGAVISLVGVVPPVALLVGFLAFFPSMVLRAAWGAAQALRGTGALSMELG